MPSQDAREITAVQRRQDGLVSVTTDNRVRNAVGLIAGNGMFPAEFIENARASGCKVYVVAHREETVPAAISQADEVLWIRFGQVARTLTFFKKHNVASVAFLGGIRRTRLFRKVRLDWLAVKILARALSRGDDALLRAVAREYEDRGFSVISPEEYLPESLPPAGCLTNRALTAVERRSALIGWQAATYLGELDTGQTAVVNDGVVVALEAIEGTDEAIRRAGELSGKGSVVVKLPKPSQDRRLDLPGVGRHTIEQMRAVGASALVLQAGGALLLNPSDIVSLANKAGIAIEVCTDVHSLQD